MGLRIGIDLMGGDNPPKTLFPAILESAKRLTSEQSLLVLASEGVIKDLSSLISSSLPAGICARVSFKACEEVIAMTDDPLTAIRRKRNSSLVLGMRLLKKNEIDAFVSCGNTGALIASAALALPLLNGVSHPALLANLPTERGSVAVLDVGGNILNKAQQLARFAFLGAAYQRAVRGLDKPVVGLLNVGVESRKGTEEVRLAYEILSNHENEASDAGVATSFQFAGNIEGRDLFKGHVDVLVTDGFTGNVLLKTAEGVAAFVFDSLEEKLGEKFTPAFEKAFSELKSQFNYAEYPGAFVCGIDGVVVKVHGNATADSLLASISIAIECVEKRVISRIKEGL